MGSRSPPSHRRRNRNGRTNAPPRAFTFTPARSTEARCSQQLRWMDKFTKMDPPPCDPKSGIRGLEAIPGGIKDLVELNQELYIKYLQAFLRRLKPDLFSEPLDILAQLRDRKGNYKPSTTTFKLYKWTSYETNVSSLISGLNRLAIGQYNDRISKCTTEEAKGSIRRANIININEGEWIGLKAVREKVCKILFAHGIHVNGTSARNNKEENSLGIEDVCLLFQSVDSLSKAMKPMVCLLDINDNIHA